MEQQSRQKFSLGRSMCMYVQFYAVSSLRTSKKVLLCINNNHEVSRTALVANYI